MVKNNAILLNIIFSYLFLLKNEINLNIDIFILYYYYLLKKTKNYMFDERGSLNNLNLNNQITKNMQLFFDKSIN